MGDGWQPIATAPRDFTPVLAAADGVDNTGWIIQVMRWTCSTHMFCSNMRAVTRCPDSPECDMCWVTESGGRLGVPVLFWMPLPEPPTKEMGDE